METKNMNKPTRAQIITQFKEILEPLIDDTYLDDLDNDRLHLVSDLGLDSIGILQVILEIEKTFGIVIANHELDMDVLTGLKSLVALVESKLHENH